MLIFLTDLCVLDFPGVINLWILICVINLWIELWCWRRLLRVPWTSRRSNQSILKKISPEYSLAGLMLKLKLQYFGHLMWRTDSLERPWCWERLKMGGEGDDRGWNGWMTSLTRWTWVWVSSGSWWWTGKPRVLQSMGSQRLRHNWVTELNWLICQFQFKLLKLHTFFPVISYCSSPIHVQFFHA